VVELWDSVRMMSAQGTFGRTAMMKCGARPKPRAAIISGEHAVAAPVRLLRSAGGEWNAGS
jgi:hypothetical protein